MPQLLEPGPALILLFVCVNSEAIIVLSHEPAASSGASPGLHWPDPSLIPPIKKPLWVLPIFIQVADVSQPMHQVVSGYLLSTPHSLKCPPYSPTMLC